jgi:hypothetical protein
VGDHDARHPELLLQPVDLAVDDRRRHRIEARRRLVVEEDLRLADDRPGQPDPLLHAAGEVGRRQTLHALEPDHPQRLAHLHADDAGLQLRVLEKRQRHVLADRHPVDQRPALEEVAEALAELAELLHVHVGDVPAVDQHAPLVRLQQADDVLQRDALARAGPPDDHVRLPAPHRQVEPLKDPLPAEAAVDVLETDQDVVALAHR